MEKRKVFVSSCLLGCACRYDGASKPSERVMEIANKCEYVHACPEVLGGLPTPRVPSEIVGDRVVMANGADVTAQYQKGARSALDLALDHGCEFAILKARSPSCGKGLIYDGTYTKTLTCGNGVTAQLFIDNGIKVFDETELEGLEL